MKADNFISLGPAVDSKYSVLFNFSEMSRNMFRVNLISRKSKYLKNDLRYERTLNNNF